jgi:hypothetical protein
MKQVLLLPLLLLPLLAGCSGPNKGTEMTDAECRQKADRDPQVALLLAKTAGGGWSNLGDPNVNDLKHDAYMQCMRGKGLLPKGGVEPVKRFGT